MEYPRLEKMRAMVRLLNDALDEARQVHGEQRLRIAFGRNRGDMRLEIVEPRRDIVRELGLDGDEAFGLFQELGDDGYISADYGKLGRLQGGGMVIVTIPYKGRALIEEVPDPHTKLYEALDELVAAIEGVQGVDRAEQEQAVRGARRLREVRQSATCRSHDRGA